MKKMKSQQRKAHKINDVVCRDLKETVGDTIEIFRIAPDNSQLDEIEITKVEHQEGQDRSACPNHES